MSGTKRTTLRRGGGTWTKGCIPSIATFFLWPCCAVANVLEVPSEFASIGEALRVVGHGDTVLVAPGIYGGPDNRNLDVGPVDVVIRSRAGAAATQIDCEGRGRGFIFDDGQSRASRLEGFTIIGGRSRSGGAGISVSHSSPTVVDCAIRKCVAESGFGGGILVDSGSSPRIAGCVIEESRVLGMGDSAGGGIACNWFSTPEIEDCVIRANRAANGGGLTCQDFSSPVIRRTRVVGNVAEVGGGGAYCYFNSSPTIIDSEISGNTADGIGGGLRCRDLSRPRIHGSVVSNNVAGRFGGGLQAFQAAPELRNTRVVGNWSAVDGGGIHASGGSSFVLEDCLVAENGAARAGGGLWCDGSTIGLWSTTIYGPCAADEFIAAGPIHIDDVLLAWGTDGDEGSVTYDPWKGEPVLLRCEFVDNEASAGQALWTRVDGGAHVKDTDIWSCRNSMAWLDELPTVPCPSVTPAWSGKGMSSRTIDALPVEGTWFDEHQQVPCIPASNQGLAWNAGWSLTSGWIERFSDHAVVVPDGTARRGPSPP